ncbi:hypothetical protein O3P69_013392 [Scylla paramamosain]|uniref:Uncharacterized protein n=1 Tax=Scylla paramamosain TaxID=85552 RepID=A0AAW0U005_SCYPA
MDRIESLIDIEENEEYGGVRWKNPEQGESEVNANQSTSEVRVKPSDIKILELDELQRLNSAARLQMFFESVERCTSNSDTRLEVAKSRVDGDLAVMIHTVQRQGEVKFGEVYPILVGFSSRSEVSRERRTWLLPPQVTVITSNGS